MSNQNFLKTLEYIRNFCLISVLDNFFNLGIGEYINKKSSATLEDIAFDKKLDKERLEATLNYLKNEGFVSKNSKNEWIITNCYKNIFPYKAWIEMMVGGYGQTFLNIDQGLYSKKKVLHRNIEKVSNGSCGISSFGALPLVKEVIINNNISCKTVADVGCGNGNYLIELSNLLGNIKALGIESNKKSANLANNFICKKNLSKKIKVIQNKGQEIPKSLIDFQPDVVLICFVLHEILAQEGKEGVIKFLIKISTLLPNSKFIIIEVDDEFYNSSNYLDPIYLGYYNPYFLLHFFTNQKLMKKAFWREVFKSSGLLILKEYNILSELDSTGIEVCFLLSKK